MDASREILLRLPANRDDLLIARMALSGLGMLAGLDTDLIGDLRTVTNECCDCLLNRRPCPQWIVMKAAVKDGRLSARFSAEGQEAQGAQDALDMDLDVARCVLETLMPQVSLDTDAGGICSVQCSMPL